MVSDSLKNRVTRAWGAFQMPQLTYPGRVRVGATEYVVTQIVRSSDGTLSMDAVRADQWEASRRA